MVGDQLEKRDALRNAALGSLASDEVAGLSKYEAGNAVRDQFYVPANKAARKKLRILSMMSLIKLKALRFLLGGKRISSAV